MNPDLELEAWREQWQADAAVPADLLRKVERGTRIWSRLSRIASTA